ncbi:MAG: hypothetical protein ABSE70_00050 [Candidatus Limnocylindrales bacterium]
MERHAARENAALDPEETRRRLTSEVAEVESAMALVASGSATRITLAGLRFGGQLAERFSAIARLKGLRLEPLPWPDDSGCDLVVRRSDE